jgi:hypothetical protein
MKVVYLNDTGIPYEQAEEYFAEAAAWASRQCSSFVNYHVQDVSDVSLINDFITEYQFQYPTDALQFQLKWKTS